MRRIYRALPPGSGISSNDALAHVGAARHQSGSGIDDHAVSEERHRPGASPSSGIGVIAAFQQGQGLDGAKQRLRAAGAHTQG